MIIRTLGLSVVYAVWSGVGTALTAAELAFIGLIVVGVMGLHASSRAAAASA